MWMTPKREDEILAGGSRSEEHTSELQSRLHLVCRLLLEKKKFAHDYLYLEPGVYDGLQANPTAMRTLVDDLKTVPDVLSVITRDELAANHSQADAAGRQS